MESRPHLALLAAPAVFISAPVSGIVAAAATALAATGALEARHRMLRREDGITAIPFLDAVDLYDVAGAPLKPGRVYARHPKATKADRLIVAKDLHAFIVREQIAEIVQYMRSRLHLSSLKVSVSSSQSGRFFAGGTLKAVPFSARISGKKEEAYAVEWSSHRPVRMAHDGPLIWIDDFPEIKAAAEKARHGRMKVSQSADLTFDIEAQAAKVAKIDSGWLSTFEFVVEAEFA